VGKKKREFLEGKCLEGPGGNSPENLEISATPRGRPVKDQEHGSSAVGRNSLIVWGEGPKRGLGNVVERVGSGLGHGRKYQKTPVPKEHGPKGS